MKQKLGYIIISLLAAAGVFVLGMSVRPTPAVAPSSLLGTEVKQTVSFLLDDGGKFTGFTNVVVPVSEPTVLGALKAVAAKEKLLLEVDNSSAMGAFVKQIGKQKNGTAGKYWQYWVNGGQPMVAADKYKLVGGETILWTFRKSAM